MNVNQQRVHELKKAVDHQYPGDKFVVRDEDGNEFEVVNIEPDDDSTDTVVINIQAL